MSEKEMNREELTAQLCLLLTIWEDVSADHSYSVFMASKEEDTAKTIAEAQAEAYRKVRDEIGRTAFNLIREWRDHGTDR